MMKRWSTLLLLAACLMQACRGQNKQLTVGDKMPLFALRNQNDSLIHIKDYVGKKILVIYFYPKDESPVCTKEACTFKDSLTSFVEAGAIVIGINHGTVLSHKKFCQNHSLPFNLLSDPNDSVMHKFGLKDGLISERITFVISLTGQIVFTYNSMFHGPEHVQKALEFIHEMAKKKKVGS